MLLISTQHSPSYFDQATMDKTRFDFISHLRAADTHGRFRMFSPVTTEGRTIIVHAKLTFIDDELLRIGSANINNRSMGFDSECDLVLEARTDPQRRRIGELRTGLVAHWFGCDEATIDEALAQNNGRWCAAIDALREGGHIRLRPINPGKMTPLSGVVAKHHIGDPIGAGDAWKPWLRRDALRNCLVRAGLDPKGVQLVPSADPSAERGSARAGRASKIWRFSHAVFTFASRRPAHSRPHRRSEDRGGHRANENSDRPVKQGGARPVAPSRRGCR